MQKFSELIDIITRLRAPNGCPWDQKQTPQSFKPYIIEEAHELVEAVDLDDPEHVREELGDMLFQAAFLCGLYNEAGHFTMEDVLETIIAKMIRRHPHVFGDREVASEKELRQQWNDIKAQEKEKKGTKKKNSLTIPPKSLPALKRAQRVSECAAGKGFEWPDLESIFKKLEEEIAECREAIENKDQNAISEEIGDILLVITNLCRKTKTDSEEALHTAITKFDGRFSKMESQLQQAQQKFSDLDFDALIALWEKNKDTDTDKTNDRIKT